MANLEPPSDILRILRGSLEETSIEDAPGGEEVIGYCAFLAAGLADTNNFEPSVWEEALAPYLSSLVQTGSDRIIESFRNAAEAAIVGVDDAESYGDGEDDGSEELCNIRFNLAYGGKILLHQTKLRLLRGHRYGLVGQNGAGKTTLMTAIEKGKLDGWPNHLMTHYCDSGSNVDPVYEARIVLADLMETTKRSKERCIEMMETLKFTDTMMHGTIGALSGGWQMKLRLIRAVLLQPDILLLDEPTNHLDSKTVEWLTSYLQNLKETTVITVSHDTPFMENICTDIIHYENRPNWGPYRKLVHYKGSMSVRERIYGDLFVEIPPCALRCSHSSSLLSCRNSSRSSPRPSTTLNSLRLTSTSNSLSLVAWKASKPRPKSSWKWLASTFVILVRA